MEKIFDIAKDSEKSWGVIAQGIDGNFQGIEKEIDEISTIDQKNLVDFDNLHRNNGLYYKGTTGVIASGLGDTGGCFDLVKVKPNTQYYLSVKGDMALSSRSSDEVGIVFYKANEASSANYVGGVSASQREFTTPNECEWLGISYTTSRLTLGEVMLNYGIERGEYVPYIENPQRKIIISDGAITTEKIANNSVTEDKLNVSFLTTVKSKNLVDWESVTKTPGRYYKGSTGAIASGLSDGGCLSLIRVESDTQYYLSVKGDEAISSRSGIEVGLVFYKGDEASIDNYVGGVDSSTKMFVTPSECRYLGISYTDNRYDLGEIMLNYGAVRDEYEEWYEPRKSIVVPNNSIGGDQIKDNSIPQSKLIVDRKYNSICIPQKIYLLSGVNNDIFYEPILQKWLPYRYDVRALTSESGGRDYIKANKRVCTLKNPTSQYITLKLYDDYEEKYIDSKTVALVQGIQSVGATEIKVGIIGDSYTDGGCWESALLKKGYVPNIKLVGTRRCPNVAEQFTDGRSGWALKHFFSVQTGADYFNPYYHPEGSHRYWGNTAFWANVCGGSPTGYGTRYPQYADLCDAQGWPNTPVEGDVIYDSTNAIFKEYINEGWVNTTQDSYYWEFSYQKYVQMWNVQIADYLCVMLGVNDFWLANEPTDDALATWNEQINVIISSFKSVNANGKFVVLTTNTVTHPNTNHYQPLDVHRRMWKLRKSIIENFDNKEDQNIYVVDTAQLIDSENSFTLDSIIPFDDYPNGYDYDNKETYTKDGQHPRVSYCTLGYSLAAFLQYHRQETE